MNQKKNPKLTKTVLRWLGLGLWLLLWCCLLLLLLCLDLRLDLLDLAQPRRRWLHHPRTARPSAIRRLDFWYCATGSKHCTHLISIGDYENQKK